MNRNVLQDGVEQGTRGEQEKEKREQKGKKGLRELKIDIIYQIGR